LGAQLKINEKRRLKRFSARLKVYSQQNDELMGYSENLHTEGMMIITKEPIPKNQELEIWFGATKEEKRLNRIFVSAYKVWESFTDNGERFYYSGLHFVAPAEAVLDKIQTLIYEINSDNKTS
jgi:PilZ domain-containing protein